MSDWKCINVTVSLDDFKIAVKGDEILIKSERYGMLVGKLIRCDEIELIEHHKLTRLTEYFSES